MFSRSSTILKISTGLAITLLAVTGLLFYLDVFSDLIGTPQSQAEKVVKQFLTAVQSSPQGAGPQRKRALEYFTAAARSQIQVSVAGQDALAQIPSNWNVGNAILEGGIVKVPVKTQVPGEDVVEIKFLLRRDSRKWRIFALEQSLDAEESDDAAPESIVMNFENPMQSVSQMLGMSGAPASPEEFGRQMMEGMQRSMQNATQTAEEKAARLAAKMAKFESVSPAEFAERWRHTMEITERESQEVLEELAEATDLDIQIDDLPEEIRQRQITLKAQGSHLEILEQACNEIGYYPNFSGEGQVQLVKLPRRSPVVFAGPARLEVASLTEFAPHTTGLLMMDYKLPHVSVMEALGRESLNATLTIVDAAGESLVDTSSGYLMINNQSGSLLKGLFSKVDKIKSCSGVIKLTIPTKTAVFQADQLTAGLELTEGDIKVQLKSVEKELPVFGASSSGKTYTFVWSGVQPKGFVAVAFDENGTAISTIQRRESATKAEISGANVASIKLTLVTETEEISYPFEILDIPLPNHQAQAAQLATLEFTGNSPVEVTLASIEPSRGGTFQNVILKVTNRANKAVRRVDMEYSYNEKNSAKRSNGLYSTRWLSDEETRKTGVLVKAGESTTTEFMSPFISKESNLQVRATQVVFADGTTWMAKER
ncbi:MAG: hypothetical protein ACKPEY_08875 [Planctomycetota bacterium]